MNDHNLKYCSVKKFVKSDENYIKFTDEYPYIFHAKADYRTKSDLVNHFRWKTTLEMININNVCVKCLETLNNEKNNLEQEDDYHMNLHNNDDRSLNYDVFVLIHSQYKMIESVFPVFLKSLLRIFIIERLDELSEESGLSFKKPSNKNFPALANENEITQRIYILQKHYDEGNFPKIHKTKFSPTEKDKVKKFMENKYKEIHDALEKLKKLNSERNDLEHALENSPLKDRKNDNDYYPLIDAFSDVKELFSAIESELLPKIKEPEGNWESV